MKSILTALAAFGGVGALATVGRQVIKSYRAKKSIGNILADAAEVVIDEIDPKK